MKKVVLSLVLLVGVKIQADGGASMTKQELFDTIKKMYLRYVNENTEEEVRVRGSAFEFVKQMFYKPGTESDFIDLSDEDIGFISNYGERTLTSSFEGSARH